MSIDKSKAEVSMSMVEETPHTRHKTTTLQNGSIA